MAYFIDLIYSFVLNPYLLGFFVLFFTSLLIYLTFSSGADSWTKLITIPTLLFMTIGLFFGIMIVIILNIFDITLSSNTIISLLAWTVFSGLAGFYVIFGADIPLFFKIIIVSFVLYGYLELFYNPF